MSSCVIKIIVNPGQKRKYTISRDVDSGGLLVLIHVKEAKYDLCYMADLIAEDFIPKSKYKVQFNYKSAGPDVRENAKFREKMLKLFAQNRESSAKTKYVISTMALIVKIHIDRCGSAPNMDKYYQPKQLVKISNYIKCVLNEPGLPNDVIIKIVQKIPEVDI